MTHSSQPQEAGIYKPRHLIRPWRVQRSLAPRFPSAEIDVMMRKKNFVPATPTPSSTSPVCALVHPVSQRGAIFCPAQGAKQRESVSHVQPWILPNRSVSSGAFSMRSCVGQTWSALWRRRGELQNRQLKPLLQHEDCRAGNTSQHHQRLMQIGLVLTLSHQEG